MTSPVPTPPASLPEPLLHKALAVRLQLEAWEREVALAQAHMRVAQLEGAALRAQLPALEAHLLEALGAPEGARFNWQTLTADPPETAHAAPRAAVEPAGLTRPGSTSRRCPMAAWRSPVSATRDLVVEQRAIDGSAMLLWSRTITPGQFGYLRAAADAHGRVACIGQGQDGTAWLTRDGHAIESLGATFGVFCVEVQGLLEGWEVAILRAGGYELLLVPVEGPAVVTASVVTPTSQGFIQIDDGVVLQDDGRHAVPGLVLAERAGIYAAGQNPDAGPDRVRLTDDRGRFAALVEDSAQPPHVVEAHDGSLWVCSWLKSGAWVAGYQPSDIPWGNETGPHPPEPPDPGPDPPEPGPEPGADPPSVTISSYAPTLGAAPLEVRAVASISAGSGPVDSFTWLWRAVGDWAWAAAATNPSSDLDHTFTFTAGRRLRDRAPGHRPRRRRSDRRVPARGRQSPDHHSLDRSLPCPPTPM